jgi:hypothetical protein
MKKLLAFILSLFDPPPETWHHRPPNSHGK